MDEGPEYMENMMDLGLEINGRGLQIKGNDNKTFQKTTQE